MSVIMLSPHTSSPELGLALSNFAGDSRRQPGTWGNRSLTQLHNQLAEFIHLVGRPEDYCRGKRPLKLH